MVWCGVVMLAVGADQVWWGQRGVGGGGGGVLRVATEPTEQRVEAVFFAS